MALGDIAEVFAGGTPKTSEPCYWDGGDIVWVTPTDITGLDSRIIDDSARKITKLGLQRSSARLAPAGAVLVTSRATIGATAVSGSEVAMNQGVTALIPSDEVDATWLYFWVAAARNEMISRASGTTFLEISRTKMRQMPVLLPPIEEQRRISDLLGALDTSIDNARCDLEAANGLRAAAIRSLTAKAVAGGAQLVRLADIAELRGGVAFPKKEQGQVVGDYPYFKVGDMNSEGNERLMTSGQNWITKAQRERLRARVCPEGTVIFPIIGAAVSSERRRMLAMAGCFDQNVLGLVPGDHVRPGYLLLAMELVNLGKLARQGAVPVLNQAIVGDVLIPLPSKDDQSEIVRVVDAIDRLVVAARARLNGLSNVRGAILGPLLSGTHKIPHTYDHLLADHGNFGPEPVSV